MQSGGSAAQNTSRRESSTERTCRLAGGYSVVPRKTSIRRLIDYLSSNNLDVGNVQCGNRQAAQLAQG